MCRPLVPGTCNQSRVHLHLAGIISEPHGGKNNIFFSVRTPSAAGWCLCHLRSAKYFSSSFLFLTAGISPFWFVSADFCFTWTIQKPPRSLLTCSWPTKLLLKKRGGMRSMEWGSRQVGNAAHGNQPSLVQKSCILTVISQHFHFPLLPLLQELVSPASHALVGMGGLQGDGYAAPVDGNTLSMNHDASVVFTRTIMP